MVKGSESVMQKTVVLHIGTPKTGTSSIQRCLEQAQVGGNLGPVCYPLWKGDRNQQRLAMIYPPGALWATWVRQMFPARPREFRRIGEQYRQFIFKELRSANSAVISAEALSSLSPDSVGQLRDALRHGGYREFHIVLYVRDPADYFLSQTQQDLKGHPVPPFVEDPASFRYDFLRAAETWEHLFPGKLIIRRFPNGPNHDVVEDFAGVLKDCLGVTLPRLPVRMNTSISAEAMQILQDYRENFWPDAGGLITPDAARLAEFLRKSAKDIPQTKPVLKKEVAEQVRANHKADAELLYSRYGVDLGLQDCGPKAVPVVRRSYRVNDIVESVDPSIVCQLLLRLARAELGRPRGRPLRIAAQVYQSIPLTLRPAPLDNWLRARFPR